MKKILLLSLFILSACSKSDNNNPTVDPAPPEEVYNLDVNGIGFFSGSPQVENDPRIDLSTVVQGQKKTLAVTIKNMGTTATSLLTASLSDTKFYITSSTCSSKSLPPNGGSCSLTLNFSAVGKALQVFESTLQFGTSSIPVKIEVVSSSGQSGGGSALVKMYDGATQITSPPDYSIGSVSGSGKISKVISIKNEGTAATLIGDATLSSSSFYLTSNSCVGKALVVGASCSATVNFSGSGKTAGQTYPVSLSFAGSSVSLSASTQAPPAPAPAQLVFMDGPAILSQDLHLGPYSGNVTLSKTITVKNVGASASSSLSLQLLNNAAGYFTVSNSCVNKILSPNTTCSFSLRVSTSNKPAGFHSVQLKIDQTTQNVDFEKTGAAGIITYQASYQPYGSCSASLACDGQGSKTRSYVCAKFVDGVPSGTGQLSDCTPVDLSISCDSPAGDRVVSIDNGSKTTTCSSGQTTGSVIVSCDSNYHQSGETCVADAITYSPVYSSYSACTASNPCDGMGTQDRSVISCDKFRDGQPDGSADASNCSSQAQDLTISCASPPGEKTVPMDHGSKVISCLSGQNDGSFVSGTCTDVGYQLNGETCQLSRFTVSVSKSKSYGDVTSQPLGINCANTPNCQFDFDYGTEVTLYPTVSSGNGYAFGGWTGACTGTGACTFTVDSAKSVEMIVSCENNYHDENGSCVENKNMLIARINNAIGGSIADGNNFSCPAGSGSCTYDYSVFSTVTLNAIPDVGYTFSGWSGDCSGSGICSVDMSSPRDITATFDPIIYTITATVVSGGQVLDAGDYSAGQQVNLSAQPDSGYVFYKWVGGPCDQSTNSICSFTAQQNETTEALFYESTRACDQPELDAADPNASTGQAVFNPTTGQYDCIVDSCDLDYHLEAGFTLCQPNQRFCEPQELAAVHPEASSGDAVWNGTGYTCTINNCNTSYHVESGTCFSDSQSCSDPAGSYFGVQSGTKQWNSVNQSYGYCYPTPNSSTSCKSGFFTYPDGVEYNYIYRTSSLFPANDPDNIYTNYNYAQGACVASTLSCTASLSNALQAYRTSSGGENPYEQCQVESCEPGYNNNFSSCSPRQVFFIGAPLSTGVGYEPYVYNPISDSMTMLGDFLPGTTGNAFQAGAMLASYNDSTTGDSKILFYTKNGNTSTDSLYSVNTATLVPTLEKNDFSELTSPPAGTLKGSVEGNKFYGMFQTPAVNRELHYFNLDSATSSSVTLVVNSLGVTATEGSGLQTTSPTYSMNGGWIVTFGVTKQVSASVTTGSEILWTNPSNNANGHLDLESGTVSGVAATMSESKVVLTSDRSQAYYVGNSGGTGEEIYRFNFVGGVPQNSTRTLIKDVQPGTTGSSPNHLTLLGNRLFFVATVGAETELFTIDLATSGNPLTKIDIAAGTTSSTITGMYAWNGKIYVAANNGTGIGTELYQVSETSGSFSVSLVQDINTGSGSSSPTQFADTGNKLFFVASSTSGVRLYSYDGTTLVDVSTNKSIIPNTNVNRRILVK